MKVMMNTIMPNIRELPVSLKLNTKQKYTSPIKNNGYILNPMKYQNEMKNMNVNFSEIKNLLLMMVKGNKNFLNKLIKPSSNKFIDTTA